MVKGINQWRYIKLYKYNGPFDIEGTINNDLDIVEIHLEFNIGYFGIYFVLFGLGVEIVLINKK